MLHILYLVHDLSDPAVRRRVTMLQAGGAKVRLAGFRRGPAPESADPLAPVELGKTRDGRFAQRLAAIVKAALSLGRHLKGTAKPDIIIGRNLEMLALANRARSIFGADIPIVYECLDIHRLLLDSGGVGKAMRGAERLFNRDSALLITSSPAFLREYFAPFGQFQAPVALLQNKVLELEDRPAHVFEFANPPNDDEPWRIGWFGALRCRKSLELLATFTRHLGGRFKIVLRGRPAYSEFDDFDGFVATEPHIHFSGPYRNPDDLAAIYSEVHFCWAIDFFEEGLNSSWLLPNRLYESCRYGAVPIAMKETETGRFLAERQLGMLLDEPSVDGLQTLLGGLDARDYTTRQQRITMQDRANWVSGLDDCRALVDRLRSLVGPIRESNVLLEAPA